MIVGRLGTEGRPGVVHLDVGDAVLVVGRENHGGVNEGGGLRESLAQRGRTLPFAKSHEILDIEPCGKLGKRVALAALADDLELYG